MNKVVAADDSRLVAEAIRLYKRGCGKLLDRKVQENLLDLFCRGEEFAKAKKSLVESVKEL